MGQLTLLICWLIFFVRCAQVSGVIPLSSDQNHIKGIQQLLPERPTLEEKFMRNEVKRANETWLKSILQSMKRSFGYFPRYVRGAVSEISRKRSRPAADFLFKRILKRDPELQADPYFSVN